VDASSAENLVQYRARRENIIRSFKIKEDIYICPFLGIIEGNKTGCMVHPSAMVNPSMSRWEHPQNFGFYGEGICLVYDCPAKENKLSLDISCLSTLQYSILAGHAQILEVLSILGEKHVIPQEFPAFYSQWLLRNKIPVTSFETPLTIRKENEDQVWESLALFLEKEFYVDYIHRDFPKTARRVRILRRVLFR
jgi:hypothetical protein